jgi:hypothetical protein
MEQNLYSGTRKRGDKVFTDIYYGLPGKILEV